MPQIHFLNVGDGDCTWIKHANGANTIIDVCLAKAKTLSKSQDASTEMFSARANAVKGNFNQATSPENPIEYLQQFGVKSIFRFILSHPIWIIWMEFRIFLKLLALLIFGTQKTIR